MPKLAGLFNSFDNLDQISLENTASWLKPVPQFNQLENYLADRILYPQTLPQTEADMQMDLSILREVLKINGPKINASNTNALLGDNPFLNITLRKLLIPSELLNFVPSLAELTHVFIDALLLGRKKKDWFEDLWTIVLTGDIDEVIGSVILPNFDNRGQMSFSVLKKNYEIRKGNVMIIPCSQDRCEIAYKLQNGNILGKTESAIEVYGGKLGLMIDGRSV